MIYILLLLNIAIVAILITLLNQYKDMHLNIKWLQNLFLTKEKHVRGLVALMPLSDLAEEIVHAIIFSTEHLNIARRKWERLDLRELEEFAKTDPPKDKAFTPSEALKVTLEEWSIQRYKTNIVFQRRDIYQEVYPEFIGGKITIQEAKEKLEIVSLVPLSWILSDHPEVKAIYDEQSAKWEATEWRKRLDFLREQFKAKDDDSL